MGEFLSFVCFNSYVILLFRIWLFLGVGRGFAGVLMDVVSEGLRFLDMLFVVGLEFFYLVLENFFWLVGLGLFLVGEVYCLSVL